MFEGGYIESINLIADRLDPNIIFKIMIDYTKRLFIQTKYSDIDSVKRFETFLRGKGFFKEKGKGMKHYKKKLFDADDDPNMDKSAMEIKKVSSERGKNMLSTVGDLCSGDLGSQGGAYNFWADTKPSIKRYFVDEYKINTTEKLKEHYLNVPEFCAHQVLDLIMKMYAVLKTMEQNFKFRGFMKKKTEDMKKSYYMEPNVTALCSNEELDIFKQRQTEEVPEDITIFCFLTDICRSVEIINKAGENMFAFYPMNPKVFYLTQNSLKNFRLEARIDQATTKVMDLMAYVKQFDIVI